MNKKLFEKVKDLCKDTGLSEKYLKAITEKLGGSIEDDSTDDAAIETTANLIADVATESQGEATRWANKKKDDSKKGKRTEKMTIQTIRAAKALAMIPTKRMIRMRSGLRLWKRSWLSMRLTKTRQSEWRILTLLWQSTRFRLSSVIASPNPYPMMRI